MIPLEILIPTNPQNYLEWFDLSTRPLLELAFRNGRPAHSVKVEWIIEKYLSGAPGEDSVLWRNVWHNYTQILRAPFQIEWLPKEGRYQTFSEAANAAGDKILDDAELTLWYGKPSFDVSGIHPLSTCGGVLHYLKRRLYENDTVALRELRPLVLLRNRGVDDELKPEAERRHEWIWEFSLQVIQGHYQRGMSPICLPPTPKPTPAYVQGAALDKEPIPA